MSLFILVVLFFSCQKPLQAQEILDLEKIEVTAQKEISAFNFSIPIILSAQKLEENSGPITPLLSDLPGVVANQNGGPGGRVSYFIRGTDSRHVSFTLDGLKLNDPSNTDRQFDSAFFSAPFLSQVDIHKGPQAVLYGSDSFGGQVEMISRKGESAPQTRVHFNGGSFGTMDSSISNDWKTKNGSQGTITGYRFHSDGISRLNKKRFNATEADASDITQLSSSSAHQMNQKIKTDLLFSYLRGKNELDGAISDNSHDQSTNDQYIVQQKTNYVISDKSALSLRNGLNRHQRTLDTLAAGKESYSGDLLQNEALYKLELKRFHFLGGAATEHEEFKFSTVDRSFDLHSIFAQGGFFLSPFKFQTGVRAERHVRYGSFYTGSAGGAYYFKNQVISVQYSQGYKAPSLYQLHAPPLFGFNIGNTDLVPEVNQSWEASWNLKEEKYESGVTFFQNRLSNLITFSLTQGYINQSRFIAEGVEISGKLKKRLYHLYSSLTVQDFKEEESSVLRRPLNGLLAGLSFFPTEQSEANLKGKWFSSRKDFDENGEVVKLNGYEVFDIGFKYIFPQVDLGLQLLNIFNRSYEELYGYSIMPRSVFVHLGFTF